MQGVASSNPAAPTSNTKGFRLIAGNLFSLRGGKLKIGPYITPHKSEGRRCRLVSCRNTSADFRAFSPLNKHRIRSRARP